MKPIIGVTMSYCEYEGYTAEDKLRFRDSYKVYVAYADAVLESGGLVLPIPPFSELSALDEYVKLAQGFVFTGGDDYPPEMYGEKKHPETKLMHKRRAHADLYLAESILKTRKPILAICGGAQLVNIAKGGKLIQHLERLDMHNKKSKIVDNHHCITIVKDSLLFRLFNKSEISVNSAHHQAIDNEYLGADLKKTAFAPDGTVEALELENPEGRFFLAVQWHPERIGEVRHKRLIFDAFVKVAGSSSQFLDNPDEQHQDRYKKE